MLEADVDAVVRPGLTAVSLPKVDTPEQVRELDAAISRVEAARGLPPGRVEIGVSLETARGVYFAYEIATASKRVTSVGVGTAQDGDLQADMRFIWTPEGLEQLYVRSKVLLAARASGVELPLDGVYANFRDTEGFESTSKMARQLGYRGKKLIHPSQVEVANRIFSPTQEEIDYYHRVIEAFEAALAQGSASTSVDGKLVDYAMVLTAKNVLAWAEGVKK
jgi:citrate lyase subunit beta/citryl-CoA lyase